MGATSESRRVSASRRSNAQPAEQPATQPATERAEQRSESTGINAFETVADEGIAPESVADEGIAPESVACSIAASLEVIGDRWTMLILREAFRGTRRFDHFQRDLGLARNLLSDRLTRLVDHGIFHKIPYQERPVRNEYRLTAKGVDLSPSLVALMHWGDKWAVGAAGPPVVLVHETCASSVEQAFICWECDAVVTPGQLRSRHPRAYQLIQGDKHV
jgi:DNA-binding HxlR family transcriptional regulator